MLFHNFLPSFQLKQFFSSLLQGICPGNRLKLIPHCDSGCFSPTSTISSPCPSIGSGTTQYTTSSPISSSDMYENTSSISSSGGGGGGQLSKHGKRRSWHYSPNKVGFV